MMHNDIVRRIRALCDVMEISESYFGRIAIGNGRLVKRLENGGDLRTKTRRRLLSFIAEKERQYKAGKAA